MRLAVLLLAALGTLTGAARLYAQPKPADRPRVLLLGDSIRLGFRGIRSPADDWAATRPATRVVLNRVRQLMGQ